MPSLTNTLTSLTSDGFSQDQLDEVFTPAISGGVLALTLTNDQPDQGKITVFTPIIYYIDATFKSKVQTDGYMQMDFPDKLIYSAGANKI